MKRIIRNKPILFVVENSVELVSTEGRNLSGDETVGEPPKYESDTYYKILINIVSEDACLITEI